MEIEEVIELLIPKKPKKFIRIFDCAVETDICPNCGHDVQYKIAYCLTCGQALKWEE